MSSPFENFSSILVNLLISSYFLSIEPLECVGIFDFPTEYIEPSLIFIEGFLNLCRFKTTESLCLKFSKFGLLLLLAFDVRC